MTGWPTAVKIMPQAQDADRIDQAAWRARTVLGATYFVKNSPTLAVARSELLQQVRRLFRYAGVESGDAGTPESLLPGVDLRLGDVGELGGYRPDARGLLD